MVSDDLDNLAQSTEVEYQQAEIPDFEIDALARCLLPKLREYFASAEGQAAFEEWKRQRNI